MASSHWKIIAVAAIAAASYIGHGLHVPTDAGPLWPQSTVHAAEMQNRSARDPIQWETISDNITAMTVRSPVEGGWLVFVKNQNLGLSGVAFVPDPDHSWRP